MVTKIIKNKKGWIEIVEAFVAILLIVGVILIILNKGYIEKRGISETVVYEVELSILREIQKNDTLRTDISNAPEPLPIEWDDERFPASVKDKIIARTPTYLECIGKICSMTEVCNLRETEEIKEKDIYAQSGTIVSTLEGVYYRQLNLFCWTE